MHKTQNKKGFSLIEGVIATFILSIGIIAIFSLLTKGLSQSLSNTKNITALGFAQEGVELVRVVRNNDYIKDSNNVFVTLDSITGVSGTNSTCRVSPAMASIASTFKLTVSMNCNAGYGADDYRLALSDLVDPVRYYHHGVTDPLATREMFWRRIYISKTGDSRQVMSVVFTRAPATNEWPANMNASEVAKCTSQKGCVFSQALLQ